MRTCRFRPVCVAMTSAVLWSVVGCVHIGHHEDAVGNLDADRANKARLLAVRDAVTSRAEVERLLGRPDYIDKRDEGLVGYRWQELRHPVFAVPMFRAGDPDRNPNPAYVRREVEAARERLNPFYRFYPTGRDHRHRGGHGAHHETHRAVPQPPSAEAVVYSSLLLRFDGAGVLRQHDQVRDYITYGSPPSLPETLAAWQEQTASR